MKRFIFRLLMTACAFDFVLPMIPGIQFHGNFLHAIGAGIVFSIMAWVVEIIGFSIAALLTITTFGIALIFLIPIWLIGFWFVPAMVLKLTADFVPQYLAITGWTPALWGGLVMLFIGAFTSDGTKSVQRKKD
ncbi:MAG: phage holin family protein [Candidatus Melainabacteria bacterium]|nr:phage holin family protein [Candidatus Melainabacteria bacterium]